MTRRELVAGLLLGLTGFALNWFKLPLFFNVDFLFGSIVTMFALLRFGLATALLASLIAASCTWLHWQHPWAVVLLTAETLTVGLLIRNKKFDLLVADGIYWFTVGPLLTFAFHSVVMGTAPLATLLLIFKTLRERPAEYAGGRITLSELLAPEQPRVASLAQKSSAADHAGTGTGTGLSVCLFLHQS